MAEIALSVPTFIALRFLTAPYGRHVRRGWGPSVTARLGWLLMESPAPVVFAVVYATGARRLDPAPLAFLLMWEIHYVHRAFVYPLRIGRRATRMPGGVVLMAIGFNVLNGFLNARWVSSVEVYAPGWLAGPRFAIGAALFVAGLALNGKSDGEIVEWAGWAVATWSLAGLAFAVYTTANLAPRALAHHAWYRARFPDYPRRRRALIPLIL